MKESAWHSCLHAHTCGYTHMHSCDWPLFCDLTHAHTTATHSHDHQCTYTMWHSMKVLPQTVNLALINPSFYRNQAVNQSVPSKSQLLRITSTSSKIAGCIISHSLKKIFEQTLIWQAQKVCSDPTHVLHTWYQLLPSGKRYRIPKCELNHCKYSFIPLWIKELNPHMQSQCSTRGAHS